MATHSCSTNTRSGILQSFNKLLRRAKITYLDEVMSKNLLGVCRETLEYFDLAPDSSDANLPEADDVKIFLEQSIPPPNVLFGEDFYKMPLMPLMILKDIANLYGCGTPDPQFTCTKKLTTYETVCPRITAVVWLTWLMMDCTFFSRAFIDQ